MKCTKGKLSLNNYHYPHAYLVIREGSEDNDAFPRHRKICDVTLDGKTEVEYEANAKELVRRWNAFEKDGLVDELRAALKKYGDHKVDCATNAATWNKADADEFAAMGCTCGLEAAIAKTT